MEAAAAVAEATERPGAIGDAEGGFGTMSVSGHGLSEGTGAGLRRLLMDEKFKLWLGPALNVLAWVYLALSAAALGIAVYGRFAVRVPEYGFGLIDVALLMFCIAVAAGGFWLLRAVSKRFNPAK